MKWFVWVGNPKGGYGKRDLGFAEFLLERGENVTIGLMHDDPKIQTKKKIFKSLLTQKKLIGFSEQSSLSIIPKEYLETFDITYGKFPHKTKTFNVARGIGNYDEQTKHRNILQKIAGAEINNFMTRCLQNSNLIISISQEETTWLKKQKFKKILQSTNYINTNIFKPIPTKKDIEVLFVGRNDPIKNLPNLRQACQELNLKLTEIGTNWIPQKQLAKYYNRAHITVLPSFHETFGSVVIESLACGTPVIASQYVNAAKIVPVITTDTDVQSIKEALQKTPIRPHPNIIKDQFDKKQILNKEYQTIINEKNNRT